MSFEPLGRSPKSILSSPKPQLRSLKSKPQANARFSRLPIRKQILVEMVRQMTGLQFFLARGGGGCLRCLLGLWRIWRFILCCHFALYYLGAMVFGRGWRDACSPRKGRLGLWRSWRFNLGRWFGMSSGAMVSGRGGGQFSWKDGSIRKCNGRVVRNSHRKRHACPLGAARLVLLLILVLRALFAFHLRAWCRNGGRCSTIA